MVESIMKSPDCDISVIVPCRNERPYIADTVARLRNQVGADERFTYEVLFVDGLSDDGTLRILREETAKWPSAHVYINDLRITPVAFNIGIKNARGRYVAILGAHVEIADDYLLSCLKTIRETRADNVGGPWKAKGSGFVGEAIAQAFQSPIAVGGASSHDLKFEGPLDSVWGGFYDREVFDRVGVFDEELVRNQDDELNYRVTRAGGTIWQSPSIRYTYICRDSIPLLFKQYSQYGYWKVRVIQKHRMPASARHLVPGVFVGTVGLLGLAAVFSSVARYGLLVIIALYAALLGGTALWISWREKSWNTFLVLPLVLGTFHVAYGVGFLEGVWDFMVLKKHREATILDSGLSR